VGDKPLEANYWGDVEQNGLTVEKCEAFFDALDGHIARMAGIYSRASFLNRIGAERSEILTVRGQRPRGLPTTMQASRLYPAGGVPGNSGSIS